MMKFANWLLVITTPPSLYAIWFVEDVQMLRVIAFIWGLNVLMKAIGELAGYVIINKSFIAVLPQY